MFQIPCALWLENVSIIESSMGSRSLPGNMNSLPLLEKLLRAAPPAPKSIPKTLSVVFNETKFASALSLQIREMICEFFEEPLYSQLSHIDISTIPLLKAAVHRLTSDLAPSLSFPSIVNILEDTNKLDITAIILSLLSIPESPLLRRELESHCHLLEYSCAVDHSGISYRCASLLDAVYESIKEPLLSIATDLLIDRLGKIINVAKQQPIIGHKKGGSTTQRIDLSMIQGYLPSEDDTIKALKTITSRIATLPKHLDVSIDFRNIFGESYQNPSMLILPSPTAGTSPLPKQQSLSSTMSSSSPTGGLVGSIIHKAFRASQRAASIHSAPLLFDDDEGKAAEGALQRASTSRLPGGDSNTKQGPSIGTKRQREEKEDSDTIIIERRYARGTSFIDDSFMSSVAQAFKSTNDFVSGLGKSTAMPTLLARRESMKKLASLLPVEGDQPCLKLSRIVASQQSLAPWLPPQHVPSISLPIVVGNTSQWLGEKAPPTANHRWTVYVRGVNNASLNGVIEHVTFVLHPSFGARAQQTVSKPPFLIEEVGWGEFDVTLYIKFRHSELKTISSPTVSSPTSSNKGVYVKLVHALKFSHRNPLLLAAEAKVNQEVAVAMTQPPAVAFGNVSAVGTGGSASFQSIQFLLTNPTLTTALPPVPTTPTALMHRLHCVPPNGNAYYGAPSYTPFALEEAPVVAETRDELVLYHPSSAFIDEVKSYLGACATYSAGLAASTASLPPQMFSTVLKHSPLLSSYAGKFNEWHLYHLQTAQDKRLVAAVEADLEALMQRYVCPTAKDEMQSTALNQLRLFGL